MNIREAIARLNEVADQLPTGLDTELRVHICNGSDKPGMVTPSIEVDFMVEQHRDTGKVAGSYAIVQGHPHRDPNPEGSTLRPVTMDADDVLQKWAEEYTGGTTSRDSTTGWELVSDPATGKIFVVVKQTGGRKVRLEVGEGGKIRYRPGSAEAIAAGCTCDPVKNRNGEGAGIHDDHLRFITRNGCPVHELVDQPDEGRGGAT
jgi:hypothetical protein